MYLQKPRSKLDCWLIVSLAFNESERIITKNSRPLGLNVHSQFIISMSQTNL